MFATLLKSGVAVLALLALGVLFCPESGASNDSERGLKAALAGQWDRAIRHWTKAIQKNPKSYLAHVNRGSAYLRAGYVLRGIVDWHRARDLAPPFVYALYTGDFVTQATADNLILNYGVSLELEPDHIASVIMMGSTYQELGEINHAVDLYRKSIDLTKNPLLKSYLDHWATTTEASSAQ